MSEYTLCNHCVLEQITRDARELGKQVKVERDQQTDGYIVYVSGVRVAWMLDIAPMCTC